MLDMLGLTHKDVMFPFSDLTLFKAIDNVFPQCSWARPQKSQSGGMQAVTRFEVKGFIDCKPFSYKWSTWSKAGPALCRVQRGCSRLTHEMRNKTDSQFKQKKSHFSALLLWVCGTIQLGASKHQILWSKRKGPQGQGYISHHLSLHSIGYLFVCQCCISVLQMRTHIHVMAYMAFNGL